MSFRKEHDWPDGVDPPVPYSVQCSACGFQLGAGCEPMPMCPGERDPTRLKRRSPISPVSDRREEKRKSRKVRGPLCDHVRGSICAVDGCHGRADPAHVKTVNSGGADLRWTGSRWVGRVAPLCRVHHRRYDGSVGGGSKEAFENAVALDVADAAEVVAMIWMAQEGIDPESEVHPYEQIGWTRGTHERR